MRDYEKKTAAPWRGCRQKNFVDPQGRLRVTEKVGRIAVLVQVLTSILSIRRALLLQRRTWSRLTERELIVGAANHPWLGVAGGEQ